jgi:hypothetical protein
MFSFTDKAITKAHWALSPKTKFHIQKYDGLLIENIEKPLIEGNY